MGPLEGWVMEGVGLEASPPASLAPLPVHLHLFLSLQHNPQLERYFQGAAQLGPSLGRQPDEAKGLHSFPGAAITNY